MLIQVSATAHCVNCNAENAPPFTHNYDARGGGGAVSMTARSCEKCGGAVRVEAKTTLLPHTEDEAPLCLYCSSPMTPQTNVYGLHLGCLKEIAAAKGMTAVGRTE